MGANDVDQGLGEGKILGLQPILQGRGSICTAIWVKDVRPDTLYDPCPQGLPQQVVPMDDGATATSTS